MFLFPVLYITMFAISLSGLLRSKAERALMFIIFGLPIYVTTLSVTLMYGFEFLVPVLQWFKEIVVGLTLIIVILSLKEKPKLYLPDKLMITYFSYVALYVFLPLGGASIVDKLVALKSFAFFPLIYFCGRFIAIKRINLNEYLQYICIIAIPAAAIVLWERVTYTHFQTFTGYADYMRHFYGQEPTGNNGLSWTFEAENDGPKRFASFFANPLDHASGTLTAIAAILAFITTDSKKVRNSTFIIVAFICSLVSIFLALSRASFVSYFLMIYIYAYITRRVSWLKIFHFSTILAVIVFLSFINGEIYDFIVGTLNFTNSSSFYHILQWLEGIDAIRASPLGLGLGAAGSFASLEGSNTGGESQIIIIAVQCGLVALGLFVSVYVTLIRSAAKMINTYKGKARRIAIFVLLLSCGMIIPYFTAEAMSYLYVGYILWFFAGLMFNVKYQVAERAETFRVPHLEPEFG